MAAKKPATPEGAFTEFGANGLKQYSGYVREEWLPQLIGRKGLMVLREMRDNDAIIGAIFFAIEMLLRGVTFHVDGKSDSAEDQAAADFIEGALGDMDQGWAGFLAEVLPFLLYGWDVHEIVYKYRKGRNSADPTLSSKYDDGMIGWKKWAIRSQETLLHWIFDPAGDATHLVQLLPTGGPLLQVPLEKSLHFRTTPYKCNPEGRSIIRNAYTSYYYKKVLQEIEAIGCSRDLTGLTMVWVPSKWTQKGAPPDDKLAYQAAKTMARDIARNQQEGVVAPLMYDAAGNKTFDVTLLATGGRRQFATDDIIHRYDRNIAGVVLADFITLGTGSSSNQGTGAQSKNKTDIFSSAVVAFLDIIVSEINRKAIPDLLYVNNLAGQVELKHGDIRAKDLADLATYIQETAAAGVLIPDDNLEAHVREEAGLPDKDVSSERLPPEPVPPGGDPANPNAKPADGGGGKDDGTGKPISQKRFGKRPRLV